MTGAGGDDVNHSTPLDPGQEIPLADWEIYLRETAIKVLQEQSPQRYEHIHMPYVYRCMAHPDNSLLDTRARIYELLTHCIPADLILRVR